eukprot:565589-Rhodomonas_salina.2
MIGCLEQLGSIRTESARLPFKLKWSEITRRTCLQTIAIDPQVECARASARERSVASLATVLSPEAQLTKAGRENVVYSRRAQAKHCSVTRSCGDAGKQGRDYSSPLALSRGTVRLIAQCSDLDDRMILVQRVVRQILILVEQFGQAQELEQQHPAICGVLAAHSRSKLFAGGQGLTVHLDKLVLLLQVDAVRQDGLQRVQ